jgi:hypothetical protein
MRILAAAFLGGVLAASSLPAQPPARQKAPEYDPGAVVTVTGAVEDFHESQTRGDHPGLHLILKTETETVEVHACPVRFIKELEFPIDKGDELKVVGSRPGGGGIVVAREITKGQATLILRDEKGVPIWTGR